MRRFLLGGLGIALGAVVQPALAQQPAAPPSRSAAFGRPSAVPGPSPSAPVAGADPGVTPAGLFRTGPDQQAVTYAPGSFGAPTPVISQPPGGSGGFSNTPVGAFGYDSTAAAQPPQGPLPAPRGVPGPPSVTETRDPTGRIPTGTVVPSVSPDGFACPDLGLEDPLFGGGRGVGLDRLRGCGRTWVTAELLLWWNKSAQVPPLVTTSSAPFNGIIGRGDTRVLLGGTFGDTFHVGGRVGAGHWFDDCEHYGIDARLFWVAPSTATFSASDPPYQLLARPFTNVNPNLAGSNVGVGQSSEVVAGPGVANGNVTATMKSTVWGAEVNYRQFLAGTPLARLDLLVGYRYLDVNETLTITESFDRTPGSNLGVGVPAQTGVVSDQFRTDNQFHGGQVGLAGTVQRGPWSVDARTSIAFGTVYQTAEINAAQVLTFPNGSIQTAQGGLLAVPGANIGRYSQSKFAVLPEIGLNVGYNVTPRLKVYVGYDFLYLSSALRPGNTIDTSLDAARVPNLLQPGVGVGVTPVRPAPQLVSSGYFIQGINFGLAYRW
jgi:hypothetical protein